MSHLKERNEKICLNCGVVVQGKYCQNCGQENIEPKETVWHLVSHFFQDITHFDGKFFDTLRYLITRPGFLSKEYLIGRRAKYVNPVRMYIFTSAFFFLIFFSFLNTDIKNIVADSTINGKTYAQIERMDSLAFNEFTKNVNKEEGKKEEPMSRVEFKKYFDISVEKSGVHFSSNHYKTKAEYDSVLKSGAIKQNWWQRKFTYKEIEINTKFKNSLGESISAFTNILIHSLPQMFFISLPLFALLLQLLYIRRKEYYYVNHAIFSIHFYIFFFIAMLVLFGLSKLNTELNWTFIKIAETIIWLGSFFYLYKAMRNFYQQRRAKTIIKFLLFNFLFFNVLLLVFIIFVFFSLFKL